MKNDHDKDEDEQEDKDEVIREISKGLSNIEQVFKKFLFRSLNNNIVGLHWKLEDIAGKLEEAEKKGEEKLDLKLEILAGDMQGMVEENGNDVVAKVARRLAHDDQLADRIANKVVAKLGNRYFAEEVLAATSRLDRRARNITSVDSSLRTVSSAGSEANETQ